MSDKNHLQIIKKGSVFAWNSWRTQNSDIPDLSEADLSEAQLSNANFSDANLSGVNLSGADLSNADLSHADLNGADLRAANLSNANLMNADLNHAALTGVNLQEAYLHQANMRGADLSHADLRNAVLSEANLGMTILREVDFTGAHLSEAILQGSDLSRATLHEAHLVAVDLKTTNLTMVNLSGADLMWADLSGADLKGADFTGTLMSYTNFGDTDLSAVKGLDNVIHKGPSTIGVDTLFRSDGNIPDVFLRGAGVPEHLITFLPSLLLGRAIQFYSCFISYSHQDEEFAQRLHSRMRSENLRVWYAPEDMKAGHKLHEEIFRAIQIHDKVLLVLSENSMRSEWVMTEIRRARKAEREENRRKLFPIRLVDFKSIKTWECFDVDSGKDLAVELREFYIPDFSNWKDHDSFEKEFAKLLRDLRATEN